MLFFYLVFFFFANFSLGFEICDKTKKEFCGWHSNERQITGQCFATIFFKFIFPPAKEKERKMSKQSRDLGQRILEVADEIKQEVTDMNYMRLAALAQEVHKEEKTLSSWYEVSYQVPQLYERRRKDGEHQVWDIRIRHLTDIIQMEKKCFDDWKQFHAGKSVLSLFRS